MLTNIMFNMWAKIKKFLKKFSSVIYAVLTGLVYGVGLVVMFNIAGDSILMRIFLCLMCFGIGVVVGLLWEVFHD